MLALVNLLQSLLRCLTIYTGKAKPTIHYENYDTENFFKFGLYC